MNKLSLSLKFIFIPLLTITFLSASIFIQCNNDKINPVKPVITQSSSLPSMANEKIQNVAKIQNKHSDNIMSIPGVVGMGIGLSDKGKEVIRVFTLNSDVTGIPNNLDSVPVEVKITGMFVFHSDPTARFPRPVPIGVSTGHPLVTAGTIACRVKNSQGQVFALSNNHVFANSNDAIIGDNILQPGVYDLGVNPEDAIGTLYDFENVSFDGSNNTIDAAITLSSPAQLSVSTLPDGYGTPNSTTVSYYIGQKVQKYGRTTKLTHGEVTEINVLLNICYKCNDPLCWSCEKMAKYVGQISISSVNSDPFSDGGDSGSLIVTDDNNKNPVALLFAGSPIKTIANPIDLVLQRFNVTIDDGGMGNNIPPLADFSYSVNDYLVNFTNNSSDIDGSIVSWNWNFGDGNVSTEENPTHTFTSFGEYSVALTVLDDKGAAGSASQNIYVGDPPNSPPVSDYTFNINGFQVSFSDNSSDQDGQVVAWSWDFGDGTSSTEQNPVHSYTESGFYSVKLTVTDNDGDTASSTKTLNITGEINEQPVADFSYTISNLLVIFADQSLDPDGRIISWTWDFGDGGSSPLQSPNHFYSESGTYTVSLTVIDNKQASHSITKNVSVGDVVNNPPVADFSYTTSDLLVVFTDQSSDSDGNISSWTWDFGDGGSSPLQSPNHFYSESGTFAVTLTVTDNKQASHSITKNVSVGDVVNNSPVADFNYTVSDLLVTFSDNSSDQDGQVVAWSWDFGDGSSSTEQNPVHSYTESGDYSVKLTVTDNDGNKSNITKILNIIGVINEPPLADFIYIVSDLFVTFTDQSSDPDGHIISWNWDFGDGGSSPLQSPNHFYLESGTYEVTLTVTDDNLATHSITQNVTVIKVVNDPPVADFSFTISELLVTFTDQSSDPDGHIISWNWDFGDDGSSPLQSPNHFYSASGTYAVTLTVTDDKLATHSITQNVTVIKIVNDPPVADFSFTISDLLVTFTDQSSDPDGHIISWNWDFGDGGSSPLQSPNHFYSASGTYAVTLTVTDNNSDTNSYTDNITITDSNVSKLTLSASKETVKGKNIVNMVWDGAVTNKIEIYRNDSFLITTKNDGQYSDNLGKVGGIFTYKIKEQGTLNWSNEITVIF